jgi:hypothetical protein
MWPHRPGTGFGDLNTCPRTGDDADQSLDWQTSWRFGQRSRQAPTRHRGHASRRLTSTGWHPPKHSSAGLSLALQLRRYSLENLRQQMQMRLTPRTSLSHRSYASPPSVCHLEIETRHLQRRRAVRPPQRGAFWQSFAFCEVTSNARQRGAIDVDRRGEQRPSRRDHNAVAAARPQIGRNGNRLHDLMGGCQYRVGLLAGSALEREHRRITGIRLFAQIHVFTEEVRRVESTLCELFGGTCEAGRAMGMPAEPSPTVKQTAPTVSRCSGLRDLRQSRTQRRFNRTVGLQPAPSSIISKRTSATTQSWSSIRSRTSSGPIRVSGGASSVAWTTRSSMRTSISCNVSTQFP